MHKINDIFKAWFKRPEYKIEIDNLFIKDKVNVYLCGPIGKTYTNWRKQFKDTGTVHFVNPEDWYFDSYEDTCKADMYAIRKADALFVYVPVYSPGTAMELFYSRKIRKPIFAAVLRKCNSPWYYYAIGTGKNRHLFTNLRDAKKAMLEYFK